MEYDEEGFSYPVIDSTRCIACGRCEKVCPFTSSPPAINKPDCYAGWQKDLAERKKSTSGGAFAAIAHQFIDEYKGHVYGAAYDDQLQVHHEGVTEHAQLASLCTTKYVQSDLSEIYAEIRSLLAAGENVLFSGTPCQVQGLLNVVSPQESKHLYTISLVCHGVASPMVLQRYLEEVGAQHQSAVSRLVFRDKREINGHRTYKSTTIYFQNGEVSASEEDPYTLAFGIGLINRPSCFECPFSRPERNADITIGDFWGIENAVPSLRPEVMDGISLMLVHSEKGKRLAERIPDTFQLIQARLDWAVNPRQQQLIHPMKKNEHRDVFMAKIAHGAPFLSTVKPQLTRWKIKKSLSARIARIRRAVRIK